MGTVYMSIPPIRMTHPDPDEVFRSPSSWEEIFDYAEAVRLSTIEPVVIVTRNMGTMGRKSAHNLDAAWVQMHPFIMYRGGQDEPHFFRKSGPRPIANAQHYQHRSALRAKLRHMVTVQKNAASENEPSRLVILNAQNWKSTTPHREKPWYKSCGAKATGSAVLHEGADLVGMIPTVGWVEGGLQIIIGVISTDWSDSSPLGQTGKGLTVIGTAATVGKMEKVAFIIGKASPRLVEGIPGVGFVAGVLSMGADGLSTVKSYNACKATE